MKKSDCKVLKDVINYLVIDSIMEHNQQKCIFSTFTLLLT